MIRWPEWLLILVGNTARRIYEYADRQLEAGESDVIRHAALRWKR